MNLHLLLDQKRGRVGKSRCNLFLCGKGVKNTAITLPSQEHGADSMIRWHSTDKLGELHGFVGQTISMNKIPGKFFI